MPLHAFNLLVLVVESYVQINQVNSVVVKWQQLLMTVNVCCGVAPSECKTKHSVFDRVMKATNVSLNADVSPTVKERQVRWTTHANGLVWFMNFQTFLIEFNFARVDSNGELDINEETMWRIMNVDETKIAVDASKTRAGGRPGISFHDPHLPLTSRAMAKSSLVCMEIFGSNATGKCMPLHWQLPTSATIEEREKIKFKFLTYILDTRGRFGCAEERIWPASIGMNEMGGMLDDEFKKYIDNSICPLFPDMEDMPGKHVLLKVDSGPGRNGRELLMKCRFCGLYIYPGLPNTSSVQQETDINYGPFKTIVRNNLKQLSSAFFAAGVTIPLGVSTFGLIVYSGTIPVDSSMTITCKNALAELFNIASNKSSWSKVSAVPHTRKCLTNPMVRHEGTDEHNPQFHVFQDIQSQNDYSTTQLNIMGYRGDALRAQFGADKVSERQASVTVTVPHTREQQQALAAAGTHGKKFFVMEGEHVTTDDMFKVAKINRRTHEAAENKKRKKSSIKIALFPESRQT
jgi:hypothetical protein